VFRLTWLAVILRVVSVPLRRVAMLLANANPPHAPGPGPDPADEGTRTSAGDRDCAADPRR
jgi:hypothetical protein